MLSADTTQEHGFTPGGEAAADFERKLPTLDDLNRTVENKVIPTVTELEGARSQLDNIYTTSTFNSDGALVDEEGREILSREEYLGIKDYFADDNWLLSKDERLLLEHVATVRQNSSGYPYTTDYGAQGMSISRGARINTTGLSSAVEDQIATALEGKSEGQVRDALHLLSDGSKRLIELDQAIRTREVAKHTDRGNRLRQMREQKIADMAFKRMHDATYSELLRKLHEEHPDPSLLDPQEAVRLLAEASDAADTAGNEASEAYLAARQKAFAPDSYLAELRRTSSAGSPGRDGSMSRRSGESAIGFSNANHAVSKRMETRTDKALSKWDRDNTPELERIQSELSSSIARALGEVGVYDAKGKLVENGTTKFKNTLEEPGKAPDSTTKKGAVIPGKSFLNRPMKLSRKEALTRRNAAYHSGKKRKSRRAMQAEIDATVAQSTSDYTDTWKKKRELTTRQMELYAQREHVMYAQAVGKLVQQLDQL